MPIFSISFVYFLMSIPMVIIAECLIERFLNRGPKLILMSLYFILPLISLKILEVKNVPPSETMVFAILLVVLMAISSITALFFGYRHREDFTLASRILNREIIDDLVAQKAGYENASIHQIAINLTSGCYSKHEMSHYLRYILTGRYSINLYGNYSAFDRVIREAESKSLQERGINFIATEIYWRLPSVYKAMSVEDMSPKIKGQIVGILDSLAEEFFSKTNDELDVLHLAKTTTEIGLLEEISLDLKLYEKRKTEGDAQ